jgi:hypothetical protein
MRKHQVQSAEHAFAYLIDCTLATVAELAMKKSFSRRTFQRQVHMAQTAIDWAIQFNVSLAGTRAAEVIEVGGDVAQWAALGSMEAA